MTTTDRDPASRSPTTSPSRATPERQRVTSLRAAAAHALPADPLPPTGLPAPAPAQVQKARAYLTPRYATGVDEVLWEARERPMPDHDAIDAIITASVRARRGAADHPDLVEVAAALVVLGAVRLNLDQTEARLLNTAQASGMSFDQIAAIFGLSAEAALERYRRLKPRLDVPAAPPPPPLPRRTTVRDEPSRLRRPTVDQPIWDELDDEDWGT
ncbi:hypothetical protein GCM10023085_63890 [Actinomadura viridis]